MQTQSPQSRKRGQDASEAESSRTPYLIDAMMANMQLEEKLTAKTMLQRFFSMGSIVSTSSSFANRQQDAIGTRAQYRCIGAGTCGQIFKVPGTSYVFKLAKHAGGDTDMLWNDYSQHVKIQEVFDKLGRNELQVRTPRVWYFVQMDDDIWWLQNRDRFPKTVTHWTNLLCTERILPIPRPLRECLIEEYCPKNGVEQAKETESNKDCLVRLYLGKRRSRVTTSVFSLRNFCLHVDQMEELELKTSQFAIAIAEALAWMHWACRLDANDVEFVMGSAPDSSADPHLIVPKPLASIHVDKMKPNTSTWNAHINDFKKRQIHIWMLDFNRCRTFHPSDLTPLVTAFFLNDPYYPRPHSTNSRDQHLWTVFRETYEDSGRRALNWQKREDEFLKLPGQFMDMVEETQKKRLEVKQSLS
ncbi:hypothetical protein EKO04_006722 [Ascochyta lentis]|uniref:DUF3669 domain-containing protein n=1 Tax=Ascochyta lentis TaxID=205686 RepID=A0A8H7MGA8_9PLEO|nr:hypothetical protein EKO04_006722 [Ascochyta lentis]